MKPQHVQITTKNNCTRIFVDGKEINGASEVTFSQTGGETPIVEINCYGYNADIDTEAYVSFSNTSHEILKENQALKKELEKHKNETKHIVAYDKATDELLADIPLNDKEESIVKNNVGVSIYDGTEPIFTDCGNIVKVNHRACIYKLK